MLEILQLRVLFYHPLTTQAVCAKKCCGNKAGNAEKTDRNTDR
jgi:hypothetical protein